MIVLSDKRKPLVFNIASGLMLVEQTSLLFWERGRNLHGDKKKVWPKQKPLQGHNNRAVFEKIALACTLDVAIELAGVSLTNGKGGAVGRPELKKMYRSPWRTDNTPSLNFFKLSNGII